MTRRAFSLAEVMVFGLLALGIFTLAFGLLRSASRESARTQLRLKGVQAVTALIDRIELDLHGCIYFQHPVTDEEFKLELEPGGQGLHFYRYALDAPATNVDAAGNVRPVAVQRVQYFFDPAAGAVSRQVSSAKPEILALARYRNVKFSRSDLKSLQNNYLLIEVTWVPEELRGSTDPAQETLVFNARIGLLGEELMRKNHLRTLNPTSKFAIER